MPGVKRAAGADGAHRRVRRRLTWKTTPMVRSRFGDTIDKFRVVKVSRTVIRDIVIQDGNPQQFANDTTNGYFSLDTLPNYTEFTSLFDSYQINAVDIWFHYAQNVAWSSAVPASSANTNAQLPMLLYCPDVDDGTTITTTAMQEKEGLVVKRLDKPVHVRVVPKATYPLYNAGFTTGYAVAKGAQWCDNRAPSIQHYGIKFDVDSMVVGGPGTHAIGTLRIVYKYELSMRSTV